MLCADVKRRESTASSSSSSIEFVRLRRNLATPLGDKLEAMAMLFSRMVLKDLGIHENEFDLIFTSPSYSEGDGDIWSDLRSTWHISPDRDDNEDSEEYDTSDVFVLIRGMILYERFDELENILASSTPPHSKKRKKGFDAMKNRLEKEILSWANWTIVKGIVTRYCLETESLKPGMLGTSTFLLLCKDLRGCLHSCLPTHQAQVRMQGSINESAYVAAEMTPMRLSSDNFSSNSAHSKISMNWVGALSLDNLSARKWELKKKFGKLFECQCPLCLHQGETCGGDGGPSQAISKRLGNLLPVSYYEMGRQNFAEAEKLLRQVVQQAEQNEMNIAKFEIGEAYHALGAALMAQGRWQESHEVWLQGASDTPGHKRLQEIVLKLKAYDTKAAVSLERKEKRQEALPCHAFDVMDGNVMKSEGSMTVLQSKGRAVDTKTSDWLISAAESHALISGWSTQRHHGAPTTDIDLLSFKSGSIVVWFKDFFVSKVRPILIEHYFRAEERDRAVMSIHDAFLVKYCAEGGQRHLPEHTDESSHSLIIALNPQTDYVGGGTYFRSLGRAVRPAQGHLVLFPGGTLKHAGHPITSGTRYIIAAFLFLGLKEEGAAEGPNEICDTRNNEGGNRQRERPNTFEFAFY